MENNNTSLAPQQPLFPILEKQEKQLAIVDKLLAASVQSKILKFALNHSAFFISIISSSHSLSPALIKKHKDKWVWFSLTYNKTLPWSPELIENNKDDWNWHGLSGQPLPWSLEFIDKYVDKWHWLHLSENSILPWSLDFIEKYISKWEEHGFSYFMYDTIYQKVFRPYLTDSFTDEIMNKIKNA